MNRESNVETGTYVGTGTYGSSNKNSITFSKKPKFVYVETRDGFVDPNGRVGLSMSFASDTTITSGCVYSYYKESLNDRISGIGGVCLLEWSDEGKSVSWYSSTSNDEQMNKNNVIYTWVAFY